MERAKPFIERCGAFFISGANMLLQDQIDADRKEIENAQAVLDQATAKLAKDQADLDAIQPHLSVLSEIEQAAQSLGDDAKAVFTALVTKARSLF